MPYSHADAARWFGEASDRPLAFAVVRPPREMICNRHASYAAACPLSLAASALVSRWPICRVRTGTIIAARYGETLRAPLTPVPVTAGQHQRNPRYCGRPGGCLVTARRASGELRVPQGADFRRDRQDCCGSSGRWRQRSGGFWHRRHGSCGLGPAHQNENQPDRTKYSAQADPVGELTALSAPEPTAEGGTCDSVDQSDECGVID